MTKNLSQRLKLLIDSKKTAFRTKDLVSLWQEDTRTTIIAAKRMVTRELIVKLAKGYYAVSGEYSVYELANLIISPSYVSFNSALLFWGVCFQVSDTIRSVASIKYTKEIDNKVYAYRAMKHELFFNLEGVYSKNNISIARSERALLDSFYFGVSPNVDDWEKINKTYLHNLAQNYPLSVQKKVKDLRL